MCYSNEQPEGGRIGEDEEISIHGCIASVRVTLENGSDLTEY